jgi:hypothetical protein
MKSTRIAVVSTDGPNVDDHKLTAKLARGENQNYLQ